MEKRITLSTLVLLAIKSRPIVKKEGVTVAATVNGGYATVNFPEIKERAIQINNSEAILTSKV